MSPPSGFVPAPVSPPPSVPPPHSPPPPIVFPPFSSPTTVESSPLLPGAPGSPSPSNNLPPIFSPIPGPNTTPSGGSESKATMIAVGVVVGVVVIAVIVFCYWWYCIRSRRCRPKSVSNTTLEEGMSQVQLPVYTPTASPKFHIFISHTAGEGGLKRSFPIQLYLELKKNPCYEVFIDRYELKVGTPFPEEIMKEFREIELGMGVGIMVVTREFFEKRWPMIELVEFVKLQNAKGPSQVRILPLFHELKPGEIRRLLRERIWEAGWSGMSTENHPVNVGEYRNAVAKLCNMNGVEYSYSNGSFEAEYIQEILKTVKKMYDEMHVVS